MGRVILAAALFAIALHGPAGAQQPKLVHIVVVQGSPRAGAAAEVHMLRAPESKNVIVLSRKATAFDLEAAVDVVRDVRATMGDTLTKDIRAIPKPTPRTKPAAKPAPGSKAARWRAAMQENLAILEKRRPVEVPGFGRTKMLDLVVERRAGRIVAK